jgi:hypothetical protein
MRIDDTSVLSAAIRQDFGLFLRLAFNELGGEGTYLHNWHIDAMAHELDRIRTRQNRRLILHRQANRLRHLESDDITLHHILSF